MQKIPEIPRFTTFQALKFTHSIPRRPLLFKHQQREAVRTGLPILRLEATMNKRMTEAMYALSLIHI